MAFIHLPTFYHYLVTTATLALLYTLHHHLTTRTSRKNILTQQTHHPPRKLNRPYDPLGLIPLRHQMRAFHAHTILSTIHAQFENFSTHTWSLSMLTQSVLMTREPENLKTMLATDFAKWCLPRQRKSGFAFFLGTGIFTSDGEEWAMSRELLRPCFARAWVAELGDLEGHVVRLVERVRGVGEGEVVDLQRLFFRFTMDSATQFLFGERAGCLAGVEDLRSGEGRARAGRAERFTEAFGRALERMGREEVLGRWSWLVRSRQYKEDCKVVHDFIDDFIHRAIVRRATPTPTTTRPIFLDSLLSQTPPLSRQRIRSELLNVLLAGRDTTASLLSNIFHTLSQTPSIQSSLRAELAASHLDGTHPPTYAQLKELKYLRAVLNESLRLYPVVPQNSREAAVDTVLPFGGGQDGKGELLVRKGELVGWSCYSMHRREDFYGEDAEVFRPERWMGEEGLRTAWEFLPFNGGARICLGQQLALTETSYTIVRFLQEFGRIESRDPEPWRETLGLTCTGFGGCKVAVYSVE